MNNITFVIFTYNEEKRIELVIRNVKKYGDVIVFDGGSTDNTQQLTESLGALFVARPTQDKVYVETQKMYDCLLEHVKTDWIFWDFADNILPKTALEKLREISNQVKIKYVNVPLFTYLWGKIDTPANKSYSPRFFHKDYLNFEDNPIHGMGVFTGNKDEQMILTSKPEFALEHYSLYDVEKFTHSHLRYGVAEAEGRFEAGEKFSTFRMIGSMVRSFFLYYKAGYKNGRVGFFVALLYASFRLQTHVKLYELEHGITIDSIEEKYRRKKQQFVDSIEHIDV